MYYTIATTRSASILPRPNDEDGKSVTWRLSLYGSSRIRWSNTERKIKEGRGGSERGTVERRQGELGQRDRSEKGRERQNDGRIVLQ